MIFGYLQVYRAGAIRDLPIIPIRVHGPAGNKDLYALVDSGAEQSVLPLELFSVLGLRVEKAPVVEIIGVGGTSTEGYVVDVEHQLGRHRWTAPVVLSAAIDSPVILGQAGFFEFFTVEFQRRRRRISIRRAR